MVHFFLVMLYTKDPAYLGWDPTVQLVHTPTGDANGDPLPDVQYDYMVEDADGTRTIYRTLGLITESGDNNPRQGLRIWRAVEIHDGVPRGDAVVLKDVWRAPEIPQEGSNMRAASQPHPQSEMSEEDQDGLRRSTLTVLHHGDVVIRIPTCSVPDAKTGDASDESFLQLRDKLDAHRNNAAQWKPERHDYLGNSMIPSLWTLGGEISGRLVHYRMVVKEVCTPMQDIRWDHHRIFPLIAEVCEGMS